MALGTLLIVITAFILWDKFGPEGKRLAYTAGTGPGGIFSGLVLRRRKGMAMNLVIMITIAVIFVAILVIYMPQYFHEVGRGSSELKTGFFGLIFNRG